jgi:hypothetical protein
MEVVIEHLWIRADVSDSGRQRTGAAVRPETKLVISGTAFAGIEIDNAIRDVAALTPSGDLRPLIPGDGAIIHHRNICSTAIVGSISI